MIKQINRPKESRNGFNSVNNNSNGSSSTTIINGNSVNVVDNLTSTLVTDALSANQGRILNNKVEAHKTEVTRDYMKRIDAFDSFLSKNDDDIALGRITFQGGLTTEMPFYYGCNNENENRGIVAYNENGTYEFISDNIAARKFMDCNTLYFSEKLISNYDNLAQRFQLYKDKNHKWCMDLDNLNVRGNLNANSLILDEAKYIGGKLYCTKAGMVVSKVELIDNNFKCYFNSTKDGVTIHNQFQVNDLAFCQTFNNNNVRRWWRKVIAVGADYIVVSNIDCELNSVIPSVGDNVVQLGNVSDRTRQGATIISDKGIEVYEGIKSLKMPNPSVVISPNNTKIDADKINFLGQTIINNNFKVDTEGNIELNGKITADKGYFRGFITNGITKITPENIIKMLTYDRGSFHFNLNDLSPVIIFEGDFTNTRGGQNWDNVDWKHNMQIDLPSIEVKGLQDQSSTNREWTVDAARQFLGHSITIYNMATSLTPKFHGLFPQQYNWPAHQAEWKTITTKKGYVYHLESNFRIWDDTNFSVDGINSKFKFKEEIYWTCQEGHYAVGI